MCRIFVFSNGFCATFAFSVFATFNYANMALNLYVIQNCKLLALSKDKSE